MKSLGLFAVIFFAALFSASCAPRFKPLAKNLSHEDVVGIWQSSDRIGGAMGEMTISIQTNASCSFEHIPVYLEAEGKIRNISGRGRWDAISFIQPSSKIKITKLTMYPEQLNISITLEVVENGERIGLKYSNDPESAAIAIFTRRANK